MILSDFHIHSEFCDGKSTLEETVEKAIEMGLEKIGFSGHSYTFFEESYSMKKEGTKDYFRRVNELKIKYKDKIQILCGIELDLFSDEPDLPFDYRIGSAHYLKLGDEYVPVDWKAEFLTEAAEKYFGGDMLSLTEEYYKTVALFKNKKIDIIGHLDLITKLNGENKLFNPDCHRYKTAALNAVNALLTKNIPFEINTGAISRGYAKSPYPADFLLSYIKEKGGSVIFSSDAHHCDNLCFQFDKWHKILSDKGILPPVVTL